MQISWKKDILICDGSIEYKMANEIIDQSERHLPFDRALVIENGTHKISNLRTNDQSPLSRLVHSDLHVNNIEYFKDLDHQLYLIYSKILNEYQTKYPVNDIVQDEGYHILRYRKGQHFDLHIDGNDKLLSCYIYLNDNFTGGQLDFLHHKIKIKPKSCTAVMFPSNFIYAHAALPVKKGTKYVITTWFTRNDKAEA